jgi:AraC-like DNA-binding protein
MNVSILIVRAFLEVVGERGPARDRFLAAAGSGSLTLSEFDRLQEAALAVTGDPALGIHMAERATAQGWDVIGYLASHAATLRESIETLSRFSNITTDVTLSLAEQDDIATMTFSFTGSPESPLVRMRSELTVTGFVRLLRIYCGEDAQPREVLFPYAAPPHRAEYTRVFGGKERFGQPVTALRFDRAMLSQEAVHKNPRLTALLTGEAERMLGRLQRGTTHGERVRDALASMGAGNKPTMSAVARRLGISVRSLRRRLDEEGLSFPKLVEEVHLALAKRLLEHPDRSIYEIAFEMGFSDASAFNRAFRRWSGVTPGQYRASLR